MLIALLEIVFSRLCRHHWILDRREDGTLGLRCMKCMKRKEYTLVRLITWKPQHELSAPKQTDSAPDIKDAETGAAH